jgi:hypothetical protein
MSETTDVELAIAAQALVEVPIPEACQPGVIANLAILAGHAAIVRAAPVDPRLEAAEVFHP